MPRFSLKDLLASMALIATGLALLMILLSPTPINALAMIVPFSIPLIGAGLCFPFSRWWAAVVFGGLVIFMPIVILLLNAAFSA